MELRLSVPESRDGAMLKTLLRGELSLSAARLRRMKTAGALLVNGREAFVTARVRAGDLVELRMTEPPPSFPPEDGPLDILYEDEHLLALDKPQGVLIHPTHGRQSGTLANRAWAHIRRAGGDGCHAVNRLDRDTGGVVLFAKNSWAADVTGPRVTDKTYLAVVCGIPAMAAGVIELPIARAETASALETRDMRRVVAPDGAYARTDYRVLQSRDGLSLLRLTLHTGRTHQIRVHCLAMGWPLLGDRLYATEASRALSRALQFGDTRLGQAGQALHCCAMSVRPPLRSEILALHSRPKWKICDFFDVVY